MKEAKTMRKITINQNGRNFEFICESAGTRNGFKHDCNLFIDNYWINKATCHYLNRTWESWTFQTVCYNVIYKEMEAVYNRAIETYKYEHNIKRLTAAKKQEFETMINNEHEYYKTLQTVKQTLKDKLF